MKQLIKYFVGVLAILALTGVLFAQTTTTGDISGTVTDSSGAVVPNATVTVKNLGTNQTRTVTTNNLGAYRATQLNPGRYSVTATATGLTAQTYNAEVAVGQVQMVNIAVNPQTTNEVVEVTGAAPLLQSDNPNLTTTFNQQQLEMLPTPGGDISTLPFTAPGVIMSTGGGYGGFSSFGMPGTSNLFTTNGNDNMDPYLNLNNSGASNLTLGGSEVQEATIVQNGYTAQYGRQAGAQVNFVTKSGTNQFHGTAQYLWNGAVMNANDYFNNETGTPKGRANSNQWMGSIGGPIKKDKLFFFYSNEGLRYLLPSSGTVSVPSPQFEAYTLAHIPAAAQPFYNKMFGFYNNAPGIARAVPVVNGTTGNPLQDDSGNMGCGSFAGTPTGTGGTFGVDTSCALAFNTNVTNLNKEWLQVGRVDWNVSDTQKVFFRYKEDHGLQPTNTDPLSPLFNAVSNQPQWEGQFNHQWILSPSTVNNFTASGNYYSAIFGPADLSASIAALPVYVIPEEGGANGSGAINTVGEPFSSFPQGRRVAQYSLLDDVSITKGDHAIKFGVNFRRNNVADTGPSTEKQAGRYAIFTLGEFATGVLDSTSGSSFQQKFDSFDTADIALYSLGLYVQDEWSASRNLKLTFALRADNNENPKCHSNCFALLNAPFGNLTKGVNTPYNQSITTGLNSAFPDLEKVALQPRFGFNWSPFGHQNTVIRGGVGVFSDLFPAFLASSIFNNSPNVFTPSVRTGNIDVGGAGSAPAIAAQTAAAFQNGFNSGATRAGLQAALAPVAFTEPGYFSLPNKVLNPKYLEWNFEIQQSIGKKNVIEVNYVGNHGYDLFVRNADANAWVNTGTAFGAAFAPGSGLPAGTTAAPGAPDPRFRVVTQLSNTGVSNYDGLVTTFRRSMAWGFQGEVSYTWSHTLDDVSNGGLTEFFSGDSFTSQLNPNCLRCQNYSNADYDIRHSLTADYSWREPFKFSNGFLASTIGGWSFAGKLFWRSGTPFSVFDSGVAGRISNAVGSTVLATVTNPSLVRTCLGPNDPCFTAADFAPALTETSFGNVPRNFFRGPHYFNTDLAVYKDVVTVERAKLSVGANFYNILNHPNFASPSQNVLTGDVGTFSSTVTPPSSPYGSFQGSAVSGRVIQLTAKVSF